MKPLNPFETRFYNVPPNKKTVQQCREHGIDHRGYGWSKQIDPRWNEEQRAAYEDAYDNGPKHVERGYK